MKIYEAAKEVLEASEGAMHARDIHAEIVRRNLFKFGAKNPIAVLSQTLSDKSIGGRKTTEPVFEKTAPGTFQLVRMSAEAN